MYIIKSSYMINKIVGLCRSKRQELFLNCFVCVVVSTFLAVSEPEPCLLYQMSIVHQMSITVCLLLCFLFCSRAGRRFCCSRPNGFWLGCGVSPGLREWHEQ